jgi:hypothetical protein
MSSILGIPLEYLLEILNRNNMIVSWIDFYNSSVKYGWKYKTTKERISTSVGDIYGQEYRDEVLKKLDWYMDRCPSG